MKNNGITIIELLVVVAITAAIALVAISNFPDIQLQFALKRTAYKFAQDLKRAQNMAWSGIPYANVSKMPPNPSYGVYVDTANLGNKKYIIYSDSSPADYKYLWGGIDDIVETIDFSSLEKGIIIKGVEIDSIPPIDSVPCVDPCEIGVSVNFSFDKINTTLTSHEISLPVPSKLKFTFAIESDQSKTRTVSANNYGLIEMQ